MALDGDMDWSLKTVYSPCVGVAPNDEKDLGIKDRDSDEDTVVEEKPVGKLHVIVSSTYL